MRVDLDKNLVKDVFHTIKAAINNPPKLGWDQISHVNFCKSTEILKKI